MENTGEIAIAENINLRHGSFDPTPQGNALIATHPQIHGMLDEYLIEMSKDEKIKVRNPFKTGRTASIYQLGNTDVLVKELFKAPGEGQEGVATLPNSLKTMQFLYELVHGKFPDFDVPTPYGLLKTKDSTSLVMQRVNGIPLSEIIKSNEYSEELKSECKRTFGELYRTFYADIRKFNDSQIHGRVENDFVPVNILVDTKTPGTNHNFKYFIIDQ